MSTQEPGPVASSGDFLKRVPYFSNLGAEPLRRIEKEAVELAFGRGEIIFLEGEPCRGLYVVKSGQVRIFKASAAGREQVLFIAGPGGTFNDAAVFDGGPNLASASAREASSVYLIPREVLLSLLTTCPAAQVVIGLLSARLRDMTRLVESLSLNTVTSRLGKLLLDLAVVESGRAPISSLTQDEMATIIGSVRDVVGRTLRALEKTGAIKIEGRRILVTDARRLRQIIEMSDKSRVREGQSPLE